MAATIPLVIQCAITGVDRSRPRAPAQPAGDAGCDVAEALSAWRAGAAVIHLPAREADGTPTQDREGYRGLVAALHDAGCEAIVDLSCGSAGGRAVRDERLGPLEPSPEMASFDCARSTSASSSSRATCRFLRRMADKFRECGGSGVPATPSRWSSTCAR